MNILRSQKRMHSRNHVFWIGGSLAGLSMILFTLAPILPLADPTEMDLNFALISPSSQHWLGTDDLGRDLLSRVIFAGRLSLGLALFAIGASLLIGTTLGLLAGYLGGLFDVLLMRVAEAVLALPSILVALALIGILGASLKSVVVALVVSSWAPYARLSRGLVLILRSQEYILAATALGSGTWRTLIKHIFPAVLGSLSVQASLDIGNFILHVGSLSFLGLGVQPPTPEWGAMLVEARPFIDYAPHMMIAPGIALAITLLAFNLLAEGLGNSLRK